MNKEVEIEFVYYKEQRYRIQTSGRYYQSGRKTDKERLLHRRVWLDNFGAIPKDKVIHHKNHDWRDNRIENLEIMDSKEHGRIHQLENMSNPEFRKNSLEGQKKAIIAAAKWRKDNPEESFEMHSKLAKKGWIDRSKGVVTCAVCSKEFESVFSERETTRFCSRKCSQKGCYARQKTLKKNCGFCNKEFYANKYRNVKNCSRSCASKSREAQKKC